jgi:hypothetical protein
MLSTEVMGWIFVLIGTGTIVAAARRVREDGWRIAGPWRHQKQVTAVIALEALGWALLLFGISNSGVVPRDSGVFRVLQWAAMAAALVFVVAFAFMATLDIAGARLRRSD